MVSKGIIAKHKIKLLTSCQANRTRVGVRIVRRHPARLGMKSLTSCQVNRTRVGETAVRKHPVGPGMKVHTACYPIEQK